MTTNFQNITESPEELAWFLSDCFPCCSAPMCDKCDKENCYEKMLEWLQEECDADTR